MDADKQTLRGTIKAFLKAYNPLLLSFFGSICLWAVPQHSHAGAWNLPKHEGQVIVTGAFTQGGSVFDDNGNRQDANFSKTETRVFLEYGVSDRWTLSANSAFQMSQFENRADGDGGRFNFDDFGDTEIGLRYQIKRRQGFALSAQASYIIDGGPADNILDTGGRRDVAELRVFWGQSYESERWGDVFFDAQIAGRLRVDNGRYDSTRADLTLGYKPTPKWFIFLQNFGTLRQGETDTEFDTLEDPLRIGRQAQFKSSLSIGYTYKPNRVVQFGYSETLFGRNIVKERGVFISTWRKF